MRLHQLTLADHGAELKSGALSPHEVLGLWRALSPQPHDRAGVRLWDVPQLRPLLHSDGPVGRFAASVLGSDAIPVRAILFDKSADTNWSLAWHQDRTIAVRRRVEVDGFSPWSVKGGVVHVEPPFELLAKMLTLRVHLDPVPITNAPLLVAPGSHKRGRIAEADIPGTVELCGVVTCLADKGDIWLYSTPILHASAAAAQPKHRRVLQVDYAADQLPAGLQWLGV